MDNFNSQEMNVELEQLNKVFSDEIIDPTTALNILINTAQVSYDKPHFNEIDRLLINKALICLKEKSEIGKNFMIKVK